MPSTFSRLPRRWRVRIRVAFVLLTIVLVLDALSIATHVPSSSATVISASRQDPVPRIFIASIHRNNEAVLRAAWNTAILAVARAYGPSNVYVSLLESGSIDGTKDALAELDAALGELGVRRSVVLDPVDQLAQVAREVVEKEDGWIWTPRGRFEMRRIPHLAGLRNSVMAKLVEEEQAGRVYDVVLWVNDVVFDLDDLATLLATNDGNFDAACSMDYMFSNRYYDTFALRDIDGKEAEPATWPYFAAGASRQALIDLAPVPVKACWNGMVAFKAAPFYATPALRFRGVPDSLAAWHLEASECCLIHADNHDTPATGAGVWLNPNVRVAYKPEVYSVVNPENGVWPRAAEKVWGVWSRRMLGRMGAFRRRREGTVVAARVERWLEQAKEAGETVRDSADFCLIDEMQVLESAGWRHV